jgi:hypothetical protein
MPTTAMRTKLPMIDWGGPPFTCAPLPLGWAAGAMNSPAAGEGSIGGGTGLGGFSIGPGGKLEFNAAALFSWTDPLGATEARDSEWVVTVSGLTPGSVFGWKGTVQWIVDTVPEVGYLEVSTIGVATATYRIPPGSSPLFSGQVFPSFNPYLPVVVPPSGDVQVRVYAWSHPSFFKALEFGAPCVGEVGEGRRDNRLVCVRNPEEMRTYSEPARRSRVVETPAGFRDAYLPAHIQKWAGVVRGIPWEGYDATANAWYGWEGAGGWRAFLEYARNGGDFTFYPDQDDESTGYICQLEAPIWIGTGGPDADWVMHRRLPLTMRTADGSEIEGY